MSKLVTSRQFYLVFFQGNNCSQIGKIYNAEPNWGEFGNGGEFRPLTEGTDKSLICQPLRNIRLLICVNLLHRTQHLYR